MRKYDYILSLWIILGWAAASLVAQETFVLPKAIERNVDFWVKIYACYPTHTVVIHDKEDLSVVYEVVNLDEYPAAQNGSRWSIVEQKKTKYVRALEELAKMSKPISYDSLTALQRHVYLAWLHSADKEKFTKAVENIRAQRGVSDRFAESVKRSGRYLEYIKTVFKDYGLPEDIAYLAHVESLFNYDAYSKAGAAGIWQFIPHTGRLFLTINEAVDERLDPLVATVAAAKLLRKNYQQLGSWPLAITAYNHGLSGMKDAVQKTGTNDFETIFLNYRSRSFGFASKNFYAEFLAAVHVAKNYYHYFGPLELSPPAKFMTVELPVPMYLKEAAALFSVEVDTLIVFNKALRKPAVENQQKLPAGYKLHLPFRENWNPLEVFPTSENRMDRRNSDKSGTVQSVKISNPSERDSSAASERLPAAVDKLPFQID
ncbi:MAG: lytic transglycosylase domain-containing protein [candidate division KSB1 bacterium]|nr:lytic transglycosylase domain-containing protein [candidate division KSB1 bacterium]